MEYIKGYEGIYTIDKKGNIYSLKRSIKLKCFICNAGYKSIGLYNRGKRTPFRIHKLMAITYLNHDPNGHKVVVNHIDGDKLNNSLNNLELTTQRDNIVKSKKGGSSKYVGVYKRSDSGKYRAEICLNGKRKHLGTFKTEIEAHFKYQEELKNHENTKD